MSALTAETYETYCLRHDVFIGEYKMLYDDVAVFSALPEKFIDEADPVIQQFIESIKDEKTRAVDQERLKAITAFIERFYVFTDNATAMFEEHQIMADQTILYLQDVIKVKKTSANFNQTFAQLIPVLEKLEMALTSLQLKVDYLKVELGMLKPVWTDVVAQLQ